MLNMHYYNQPVSLGISERPLTADLVIECLKYVDAETVLLPPALLEELSVDDEAIKVLKKLRYVIFGGGKYPAWHWRGGELELPDILG